MTEYFTGDSAARSDFVEQAATLYHRYNFVVVSGSVGRQAIYGDFGYEQADPLTLVRPEPTSPYEPGSQLRDFDLVMPYGRYARHSELRATGPHPVDLRAGAPLGQAGGNQLGFLAHTQQLDPEVLRPRTRYVEMDGCFVPFRTFSVGVQYCVEGLGRVPGQENDKYTRARAVLAAFARRIYLDYPDEFLPDEAYRPFLRFNEEVGSLPWEGLKAAGVQAAPGAAPERERIVVHVPRQRHKPKGSSVGELLEDVRATLWSLARDEESVVAQTVTMAQRHYTAMGRLQNAVRAQPDTCLSEIVRMMQRAQKHIGSAAIALGAVDSGLSLYHLAISGATHQSSLGD